MQCPVDQTTLRRTELDAGLPGYDCSRCSGHWLRFGDYLTWRERQRAEVAESPLDPESVVPAESSGGPRRCPDCGFLLITYRLGHGVSFALDRCGNCNGVWMDGSEWKALRERGLHDDLHRAFGPGWQFSVRESDRKARVEAQFERQLGDDYRRARELADWVANHPKRSELLAYVQSRLR